jgi:hypothetical protein
MRGDERVQDSMLSYLTLEQRVAATDVLIAHDKPCYRGLFRPKGGHRLPMVWPRADPSIVELLLHDVRGG